MELHQLQCFLAVAQTGSITKAAERLHMTQSALSRVILRLEYDLSVKLFDRDHRQITLNENGKLFQVYVLKAFENIESGLMAISANGRSVTRRIRIKSDMVTDILDEVYDLCQTAYPQIRFIFSKYYGDRESDLDDNEPPDILITSDKDITDSVIVSGYRETWCVIIGKNQINSVKGSITLRELARNPIVFYGSDNDLRFIREQFLNAGLVPDIMIVDNINRSASIINKGLAVACVPLSLYYNYTIFSKNNVPFLPVMISDICFEREIYLCRRKDFLKSPVEKDVLDYLQEHINAIMKEVDKLEMKILSELGSY